ncbi:MAG: glycosyltransferase [Lachnospiraceae bacterium]|nr:glycosyltransferase [Lachnospiraceae bacterium]
MNTIYSPYHLAFNSYSDLMVDALKKQGIRVERLGYARKHPGYLLSTKIINLNFFENFSKDFTLPKAFAVYVLKSLFLTFCSLTHIKMIYTMHNKRQHDSRFPRFNRKLARKLIRKSSAIVSLCTEGKRILSSEYGDDILKKVVVIPHPAYTSVIQEATGERVRHVREKLGCGNKMLCVFLGAISPYKNIEMILKVAEEYESKNVVFLIAGNCQDKAYLHKLKGKQISTNIKWDIRFVPDEEANCYVQAADLLLLPYNKVSSLNSGTVFLAASLGTTCVIPNIGSVQDFLQKEALYIYDYEDETEHYVNFKESVGKAIGDFETDYHCLTRLGGALRREMDRHHSVDIIGRKYATLYNKLVT